MDKGIFMASFDRNAKFYSTCPWAVWKLGGASLRRFTLWPLVVQSEDTVGKKAQNSEKMPKKHFFLEKN
jgi:hypothetical protein